MPKIPECDRCQFYSHNHHLICFPHPSGPNGDICLDFRPDPEYLEGLQRHGSDEPFSNPCGLHPNEELWEPEGASYYAGELIVQPRQRWTREEQLQRLDTHPMFTGRCPQCGAEGSVAKTSGRLGQVVFILNIACPNNCLHEPKAPIQVASFPIGHHPAVCQVVLAVPPQLPQLVRNDAGTGS